MAEVADLRITLNGFEDSEEEVETISYWPYEFEREEIYSSESDPDLDPFSPRFAEQFVPSSNPFDEEQRSCIESFGSDSDSVTELNDFIRRDQEVNLVSDMFHTCNEEQNSNSNSNSVVDNHDDPFDEDPYFRVVDENNQVGRSNFLNLGLEHYDGDENGGGFMIDDDDVCSVDMDFFVGRRRIETGQSSEEHQKVEPFEEEGLRIVGIGSDSDEDVDDGILRVDFRSGEEDGLGEVQDDLAIPLCWDCLRLEDPGETNGNDLYEWEEIEDRVDDRDVLSMMMDYEERSVSASIDVQEVVERREETMRNLEWEVLLQVNNLERNGELEHDLDHDDYIHPAEYDMLFGQFAENENAIHGSPPTAKSVVENLPSIVLTQNDIENKGGLCAVCKDEISTEEQAKLLPCSHYYHADCILPWLNIRNTCPVCRFELPTDDPDYEQRRTQRSGHGSSGVSQVRDDFQMFPED
ncbi:E3 ubiquitin-protein ligase ring1 [Thalictrum thalictroides]|uniref:RING-type E3 ubiquitin transferase n=1 Tax=Thalictrum thalictroides TaxID=46969 RepID=A0A7J6W3J7_THATH|nr:E3 ubiquitin-protein ligase ring1 [Thalictrum thalictroides]